MRTCRTRTFTLLLIALGACAGEHAHDHEGGETHHARDPATEPCDAINWRALAPDLRECRLAASPLDGELLRRANLSDAVLAGASLLRADLFKASLTAADLRYANLDGAKLTGAKLSGADLTGASLIGAVLTHATLTGARLDGATTDATTTCPTGNPGPCWEVR
ncbi:MAG TPA: pentapeptide repeat-containing protein [Kofleriaceae bacterium]|nr:pentapeptide repeat-containing protein [Kofleriaceae bacterium]